MTTKKLHKLLRSFRDEVCNVPDKCAELSGEDWYSLSVGFLLAKGADIEQAHRLAREARYTHKYWEASGL